jgi:hypothetical protein
VHLLLLLACDPVSVDDSTPSKESNETAADDTGPPDSPVDTDPEVLGVLVVNELVSDNDGSHKAEDGLAYDWVELANVGEGPVSTAGIFITDDYDEKDFHPLPEVTLQPGEYLVLYGTGAPDASGIYVPFRLSSQGEAVGLFDSSGEEVDWVVFPAMGSGSAYARLPDGGDFEVVEVPTPGAENRKLSWVSAELVAKDAVWAYEDSGTDLETAWRASDYDDSTWATGALPLGYGDSHQVTVVSYGDSGSDKYPTTYARHRFTMEAAAGEGTLYAELVVDDGAVVYLNGSELLRKNMAEGEVTWATYANVTVSGSAETAYSRIELPTDLLVEGENVLAAEVHQVGGNSSDQTFGFSLELESLVEG